GTILSAGRDGDEGGWTLELLEDGRLAILPGRGAGRAMETAIPLDQWSHVAVVIDHAAMSLVVNGVVHAVLETPRARAPRQRELVLGGLLGEERNPVPILQKPFRGKIDELYVFDRVVPPAEIFALATGTPAPTAPVPAAAAAPAPAAPATPDIASAVPSGPAP